VTRTQQLRSGPLQRTGNSILAEMVTERLVLEFLRLSENHRYSGLPLESRPPSHPPKKLLLRQRGVHPCLVTELERQFAESEKMEVIIGANLKSLNFTT